MVRIMELITATRFLFDFVLYNVVVAGSSYLLYKGLFCIRQPVVGSGEMLV